ncbi:uncharacterized protein LOC141791266 [Halichoeres trimaculatus]|uniref:uncharacterized protein LOC141791266 n=1 Tax=Halichoeres trimaculatus TaxID=147232 RepID=UPI003D9EEBC8
MKEISEKRWKQALTSILEHLEKIQYEKLLEILDELPKSVKEDTSIAKMPGKIIEFYGLEKSISAISEAVNRIPRKDEDVQDLLRPYVDSLKMQEEKENQGKKRKLNEEGEGRSAAGKKMKLTEQKEGQRSAAGEQKKDKVVEEEEESTSADPRMSCQTTQEKSCPTLMISIKDLKSRDQPPETKPFSGKVIQKSGLRRYQNKMGKNNIFFDLGVADKTACVKVRVYKKELYKVIQEGRSYMFRNVTKDQDMIKVTKPSTVAQTSPLQVPEELEMEAQKLIYQESELYSIDDAKKGPDKMVMSVEGTVEEIALVEKTKVFYQQQKKKTQRLKLKDETGSIWICMWGEVTEQCKDLSLGDVVTMTNVRTNHYCGDITLNSSAFTKIYKVKTLGIQEVKIEVIGITKATKRTTHLEAEFNQQVHTFVVGSALLMKELDIKASGGLQDSLVDKVPFTADAEIKGNTIKKIKVVSKK